MEAFWILTALGIIGLILAGPIIALVRAYSVGRAGQQNQESLRKLTQRVYAAEKQLEVLSDGFKDQTKALEQALSELRKGSAGRDVPSPPAPEPLMTPVRAVETEPLSIASTAPPSVGTQPPATAAPHAATISAAPSPLLPINSPPAVEAAPPSVQADTAPPLPGPLEPLHAQKNMEEVLGSDWLNKLGMSILVIGIALFLAYEMRELGPAGKVLVGIVVSGLMLGAGIFYERRERYELLARVAIGGGWALTFFTTYAVYHVPAARVLNSQILDLFLLLTVAAVMVAHTLRYNSQVVTGMALLLGFTTVTISKDNVYSLSAGAILALALVIIVHRRRWYELEICGILASYLNHYYWLRPIIEPLQGHRHSFPEFMPSAALLIFYWLSFRASYLLRDIPASEGQNGLRLTAHAEERVSTVAALLNTVLLLGVMKYQSVHPDWAFRFLLLLGALEFTLGQLPIARRRRTAFVVLSIIGATLMVAAIPFKYSGEALPILWLAEGEALFLAGVFLDEIVFCRLGLLASMLVAFQLNRFASHQIFDPEWKGFHGIERIRGVMEFSVATLTFYGNAHWLARRTPVLAESRLERVILRVLSYVAAVTALIGIWWLAPEPWVAVGFAALGLALIVLGSRTDIKEFIYEAHAAAILAFLRVLAVNFAEPSPHVLIRVVTVVLTASMLYATASWSSLPRTVAARYVPSWHTWTASLLVGMLAWYELKPVSVALAWTLMGLALFEIGRGRRLWQLRLQAYLAFACSFLRLFIVNFNATGLPGQLSPRVITTVPLALAFFYVYGVLDTSSGDAFDRDRRWKAANLLCFMGTFALAGWARFELEANWVVAAWAAMVWALVAIAWRYQKRIFLHQGLILSVAVTFRAVLHNFYERSYFTSPRWQSPSLTVGIAVALLFAALPFAFNLSRSPEQGSARRRLWGRLFGALERRPEQVFFFIPVFLLTVLLALEVPRGMVTVAWGMEAVAIFLFALFVGRRSYRLTGLGLLLLCVGKIVVIDVWDLQPRDRYLTFIVLGAALLGVSFLYTHFRETIRQYL